MRKLLIIGILFCLGSFAMSQTNARGPDLNSPQHLPPEAQFSWLNACYGDTTKFINSSLRGVSYQWYIFDKLGDTLYRSTNTDITFLFPSADTFYVFLQADNGHIVSVQDTILIGNNLKADFGFMHCTNQFLNYSYCATSWHWDFGDGGISTDSLPTHQYADTGTYTVTLIVHNAISADTLTKPVSISIVGYADPAFTLNLSNDTLYYQLNNFIPHSNIYWGFGDGGTSTLQQGYYVYTTSGNYMVYLNQTNGCGIIMHDTTIQVSIPAGVKSLYEPAAVKVFPNPSTDGFFHLDGANKGETELDVYDLLGNKVFSGKTKAQILDLSSLARGQYVLRSASISCLTNKLIVIQ